MKWNLPTRPNAELNDLTKRLNIPRVRRRAATGSIQALDRAYPKDACWHQVDKMMPTNANARRGSAKAALGPFFRCAANK
ncbi:hypothetical protein HLB35_06015 [Halomonas sp. TBZ9]|uniref:Uncharacterized protein n=1 Tax=Vreelandella azerica TaxID=2732867 RepID=A0A7Y3TWF7_9GAMM|nr:hypothetical protein [Halomonas azerica]NOG31433.1 hypothetical protein [Halomonas azerica]